MIILDHMRLHTCENVHRLQGLMNNGQTSSARDKTSGVTACSRVLLTPAQFQGALVFSSSVNVPNSWRANLTDSACVRCPWGQINTLGMNGLTSGRDVDK